MEKNCRTTLKEAIMAIDQLREANGSTANVILEYINAQHLNDLSNEVSMLTLTKGLQLGQEANILDYDNGRYKIHFDNILETMTGVYDEVDARCKGRRKRRSRPKGRKCMGRSRRVRRRSLGRRSRKGSGRGRRSCSRGRRRSRGRGRRSRSGRGSKSRKCSGMKKRRRRSRRRRGRVGCKGRRRQSVDETVSQHEGSVKQVSATSLVDPSGSEKKGKRVGGRKSDSKRAGKNKKGPEANASTQ